MKTCTRHSRLDAVSDWRERAQRAGYRVKQLAWLCDCTPRQLERYFGDKFQTAPHAWMDHLRVEAAQAHLASGELAKNVTKAVGFSYPPHFSYWCKHLFGSSPRDSKEALSKRRPM